MKLSYVITSKYEDDPKLKWLLSSIERQVLKDIEKEVIVVTEGTSESAKAIGIRKSTGDIICILASDNCFVNPYTSYTMVNIIKNNDIVGAYPAFYYHQETDPIINRYFSLIGANDVLSYALNKCDRKPIDQLDRTVAFTIREFRDRIPTLGDNGFFVRRDCIIQADLDHYYHIDVCEDLRRKGLCTYAEVRDYIWHRTGERSIFSFFRRRARFAAQHAFNPDRRWHLVGTKDIPRLLWFIITSATLVIPTIRAIKGYIKEKDVAWLLYPIVCILTILTYGLLVINLGLKNIKYRLSFARITDRSH